MFIHNNRTNVIQYNPYVSCFIFIETIGFKGTLEAELSSIKSQILKSHSLNIFGN